MQCYGNRYYLRFQQKSLKHKKIQPPMIRSEQFSDREADTALAWPCRQWCNPLAPTAEGRPEFTAYKPPNAGNAVSGSDSSPAYRRILRDELRKCCSAWKQRQYELPDDLGL